MECNESGDFEKLARHAGRRCRLEEENVFSIGTVYFISGQSVEVQSFFSKDRFDFVIYDLGTRFLKCMDLLLSCNQKVIIGSSMDWRNCLYEQFLSYVRDNDAYLTWEYMDMSLGDSKIHFIDDGKIKLKHMIIITCIFDVKEDAKRWYQSFV